MFIVAFGHKKQMGKDTSGQMLQSLLQRKFPGRSIKCAAFADKLYDICFQLYGHLGFKTKRHYDMFPEDKNILLPRIHKTPRQILIEMGTPAIRQVVYNGTWIDYLLYGNICDVLIITDLRFPNEVKAIQELNGILVKVTRESAIKTNDVADCALDEFQGWDYHIHNDHTKDDLDFEIRTLAQEVIYDRLT